MKDLKPTTPRVRELVEAVDVARHEAAPEREVDVRGACRGCDLEIERGRVERRRAAFSGMSTKVVVPPAASARVPWTSPSQWARPGSLQ